MLARLELFLSARGFDGDVEEVTGRAVRGRKRGRARRTAEQHVGAIYASGTAPVILSVVLGGAPDGRRPNAHAGASASACAFT